jgi:hypothetical protein
MALEMVSPPQKFSQRASSPQVSADGNRVSFKTLAAISDTPSLISLFFGDTYVAARDAAGWEVTPTAPPAWVTEGWSGGEDLSRSFSPDFSSWFQFVSTRDQDQLARGIGQAFHGSLGGVFDPLTPLLVPAGSGAYDRTTVEGVSLQAASADHSRLFFAADRGVAYLPADPKPLGSAADRNVYVAGPDSSNQPSVELLTRDVGGSIWGGGCGSRIGGSEGEDSTSTGRTQGAVSSDGSLVYFMTRPAQGPGECSSSNPLRILRRLATGSGVQIEPLVAETPSAGSDFFQGASVSGEKVYFTTARALAGSDGDPFTSDCSRNAAVEGCDLYLYDSARLPGDRLIQVSAGQELAGIHEVGVGAKVLSGTTAISTDGSRVYFVAEGALTGANSKGESPSLAAGARNLYLFETTSSTLKFVAALDPGDAGQLWGGPGTFKNRAYPVPVMEGGGPTIGAGGDGHILVFQTKASLNPADIDGGKLDIYRYESISQSLECISCRPGDPDGEPFDVVGRQAPFPDRIGTDFAEYGRWVNEGGTEIAFRTAQPLEPGDANALIDGYLWQAGSLARLPGMTSSVANPTDGPVMSHDGSVVAFRAFSALLPQDQDSASDIYVAKANGGFSLPPDDPPCVPGLNCQAVPSPLPPQVGSGSGSLVGPGNVIPQKKKKNCKKKTRKNCKKKNCKKKNCKQKNKKRQSGEHAGRNRGN